MYAFLAADFWWHSIKFLTGYTASVEIFYGLSQVARQKFCPQPKFQSFNNFWRTAYSVKISVKMHFWRDDGPSKISLKFYWRGVSLSKWAVKKILTDCQAVKNSPSNFLTGPSKLQFRRSIFWLIFYLSKFPSKNLLSVKKSTFFRQKKVVSPVVNLGLQFEPQNESGCISGPNELDQT